MSDPVSKFVVQVLERRKDGSLWPVATVEHFSGGAVEFKGSAEVAFGPLLTSTRRATGLMVLGDIQTRLAADQTVKAQIESEGSKA